MKKFLLYNLILIFFLISPSFAVTDYILTDGQGPYKLSKTDPKNIKVFLGKEEMDPLNYNTNTEKSTVFFVHAPEKGKIVKVVYDITEKSVNNINFNASKDENGKVNSLKSDYKGQVYGGDFNYNFTAKNDNGAINSDNFATSLNYSKDFGKLKLGATYTATGDNVNENKQNDLIQLLSNYNENNISITNKYTKYDLTNKTVLENALGYNLSPSTKFNFGYYTENTDNDTTNENKKTYNYSLETKLKSYAAKFYSNVSNTSNTNEINNNTYGLEFGNNTFNLKGSMGDTTTNDVKVKNQNIGANINAKSVQFNINTSDKIYDEYTENTSNANISINGKNSSLNVSTVQNFTDGEKTGSTNSTQGAFQLGKHTNIKGSYTNTINNDNTTNSIETGINYNTKQFELNTNVATKRTNDEDPYYETKAGLRYTPNDRLNWAVNYLNRQLAEDERFSHIKLTGNYKIDRFTIYGMFINRKSNENDYKDTKSTKLTYQLFKFLELSSQWTENPENNELYTEKQEYGYGAKLLFGNFSLSGNIYETINEIDFIDTEKYDIGLSAKLFGGSLSSKVIFNKTFSTYDDFYRQYVLGYTKKISNFYINLSGEYDEREIDKQGFNMEDIKGNLNMGLYF